MLNRRDAITQALADNASILAQLDQEAVRLVRDVERAAFEDRVDAARREEMGWRAPLAAQATSPWWRSQLDQVWRKRMEVEQQRLALGAELAALTGQRGGAA